MRARERAMTAVEVAVSVALLGSLLAVAVPAFVRELHASRFAEPVDGLQRIGTAAIAYAQGKAVLEAFPPSAPLTPATVPRGTLVTDPPGTWDGATWSALGFRPSHEGEPHAYAFAFDSTLGAARSSFVAHAHGDLDGDGVTSTFEVRGHATLGDPAGPALEPGMYVEAETE
jgi:type II secretory pathway pseudopilin PulG